MSIQAMSWAIEQQIVTDASARHVLLCLANYADNRGNAAFPSAATLVLDTGLSERTVRSKLDSLEQEGMIVKGNQAIVAAYIDRKDKRPICYDLQLSRGAAAAGRDERGANDVATGCNPCSTGVQMAQERGAAIAPNPSLNPSTNPSLNQNQGRAIALPDWLPADIWEKFVAYRKAGKAKRSFTAHAEELLLEDLVELHAAGQDPVKVIKQSIKRGWTGLFAVAAPRTESQGASGRDASRAAGAASIGLGARAHDDQSTVIDGDFRRIA